MALGAQVEHVVTYRGSPEGSLVFTVFTKKCQKRSKMGYPLFLTHFRELCTLRGTPHPHLAAQMANSSICCPSQCSNLSLLGIFSRWGYPKGAKFKKDPI